MFNSTIESALAFTSATISNDNTISCHYYRPTNSININTIQLSKIAKKFGLSLERVILFALLHEIGHSNQSIHGEGNVFYERDAWKRAEDYLTQLEGKGYKPDFQQVKNHCLMCHA
jgi:hypothetical protein